MARCWTSCSSAVRTCGSHGQRSAPPMPPPRWRKPWRSSAVTCCCALFPSCIPPMEGSWITRPAISSPGISTSMSTGRSGISSRVSVANIFINEVNVSIQDIQQKVEEHREEIIQFMRDICAIPSMDSQLKAVGERIAAEMNKLGFEEVRFDKMGNIMGRVGSGPRVIVYDSHIDTVGIG